MFSAKSSTITCPACSQENRATARFCVACAARLGAEPSITSDAAPLTTADLGAHGDSHFDAPRTAHSRSLPLSAAPASNAGFWIKFGIAGLVVMIGFIAWSLYILTGSKAPAQLPAGQAESRSVPAASTASPNANSGSAQTPSPSAAAAPATASPVTPSPATTPAVSSSAAPAASPRAAAEPRAVRPVSPPQRQAAVREQRARPAPSEVSPADFGGWVEPSRAPAMTSAPGYQDAGPPVVSGPGPREPLASTASPAPGSGSAVTTGRPDLGPPVTVGPGPRYDYSTPNAGTGR